MSRSLCIIHTEAMAGTVNIGRDESDASFRYKMPKLVTKIEGRGNGIKTVLVNMADVAKALKVDPRYPTKFFSLELGAQSRYDAETERAVVNGSHTVTMLTKHLNDYIAKFVVCPVCKLPELRMAVNKTIVVDCAACGHNGTVVSHKLCTYILNNPPVKKKRGASRWRQPVEPGPDAEQKEAERRADADVWSCDSSKQGQQRRREAELAEIQAGRPVNPAVEAVLAAASKPHDETSTYKTDSPVRVLQLFLAASPRSVEETVCELRRIQLARGFDDSQKIKVLLESVLDANKPEQVVAQLKQQLPILRRLATDPSSSRVLLSSLEEYVGVSQRAFLPKTSLLLSTLYDGDVLDEDVILSWADSPPESSVIGNQAVAAEVRAKAAPFVKWLREAEEQD